MTILAKVFAFRYSNSLVYAIYNRDLPIGMLMQHDLDDKSIVCQPRGGASDG